MANNIEYQIFIHHYQKDAPEEINKELYEDYLTELKRLGWEIMNEPKKTSDSSYIINCKKEIR